MSSIRPDEPGPRRATPVPAGPDRYEALLEVLEQQAQKASHADGVRPRRTGPYQYVAVAVLLALTVWVWVLPPAWLVPPPPGPPPIEQEEASLRFGMYLQAQRIRAYEMQEGRLPETLSEAGEAVPGMRYLVLEEGVFELEGSTDRVRLRYRSDQPLREWVGAGAEVLDESLLP